LSSGWWSAFCLPPTLEFPPGTVIIAKDDLVMVMLKRTLPDPDDKTKTYDTYGPAMFRFKNGKFVVSLSTNTRTRHRAPCSMTLLIHAMDKRWDRSVGTTLLLKAWSFNLRDN
jgi:hypothetical protein